MEVTLKNGLKKSRRKKFNLKILELKYFVIQEYLAMYLIHFQFYIFIMKIMN